MSLFQVGTHRVATSQLRLRWSVTVDRKPVPGWFDSEAAAWTAGVREADRLDRSPGLGAARALRVAGPC
ncbi:MAG TPA: hypothetical protein VFM53_02065 [Anaeromyxobacteraceae bacterium]|nr:hypothetical protein [Anaeromyxobacteraceae bacterium]